MESFRDIFKKELSKYNNLNGGSSRKLHNRTVKLSPMNIDLHNYLIKVNSIIKYKNNNRNG